jgi:lipid-binding SYLF domain-containing protein
MFRPLNLVFSFMFVVVSVYAQDTKKEEDRLEASAVVMEEIMKVPDTIPQDLLEKAECVVVIPSVTKVAIGFGGSYGRGAMVCRSGKDFTGPWGAPALYALEGGSFGLQLGAQSSDLVLLVMNEKGAASILSSGVKLGGEVSAVAGPKGRDAQAATDAYMQAEILSYTRSRGLFAGISVTGSTLRSDDDANERIYGRRISPRDIVLDSKVAIPAPGRHLEHFSRWCIV